MANCRPLPDDTASAPLGVRLTMQSDRRYGEGFRRRQLYHPLLQWLHPIAFFQHGWPNPGFGRN